MDGMLVLQKQNGGIKKGTMFRFIRKIKLKHRLKILNEKRNQFEVAIYQDEQTLKESKDNIIFTSCFYRNLENLEMELADVKDEIRAIEKELKRR